MTLFDILASSHNKEGVDISMRKDIIINYLIDGSETINKSSLTGQYEYCWRTIDRRLDLY